MTLVRMFEWVGLYMNLGNTKFMTCNPGFIWVQMYKYSYKRRAAGKSATFRYGKRMRVSCN